MRHIPHTLRHLRIEQCVFWLLMAGVLGACLLYGYAISRSVVHVVLRQETLVAIQEAESAVSELEAEYLARSQELTEETAYASGYTALASISYVRLDDARLTMKR